ncbi:MFS transporter [Agriterribacter sp.]|uniref:MFS transporter n=1 Tax=Agriterribacter sp. TaxID=2821509 RepID=UPI002B579008|nr:MFS transporter [Agriterribacter sp.]HTN07426.1 MFS transporter [Agriterribacter sp.]
MTHINSFRKQQWIMLLITMFCYLFYYTGRHNFGWAASGMSAELGISYTTVGWISFFMLMGYAVGQLINGNLADYVGARSMIFMGALLSVGANIAISFTTEVLPVFILWALNGYFQSMAWAPGSRIITNWWKPGERGKAFGFYTMAAGFSSVLTYLISIFLLQKDISWRYLFRLPVLSLLAASVIFYLVIRNKPSDKGFKDMHNGENDLEPTTWRQRYKFVFKNKRFLIASLAIGFQSMARYGLIFWVPVHFLGQNWKDAPQNLWATFLMPVGMALGALTFGTLSDSVFKGDRPRSIATGMMISAAISLLIFFTHSNNIRWDGFLMFCAGFFIYGVQANFWPMSPELLGEKYVGTGVGIMNMSAYLFAAIGEPVLGKIIDVTGDTAFVFLAVAVISVTCTCIISFCRYNVEKPILSVVKVQSAR